VGQDDYQNIDQPDQRAPLQNNFDDPSYKAAVASALTPEAAAQLGYYDAGYAEPVVYNNRTGFDPSSSYLSPSAKYEHPSAAALEGAETTVVDTSIQTSAKMTGKVRATESITKKKAVEIPYIMPYSFSPPINEFFILYLYFNILQHCWRNLEPLCHTNLPRHQL